MDFPAIFFCFLAAPVLEAVLAFPLFFATF